MSNLQIQKKRQIYTYTINHSRAIYDARNICNADELFRTNLNTFSSFRSTFRRKLHSFVFRSIFLSWAIVDFILSLEINFGPIRMSYHVRGGGA
jgi:hypothetical protein